MRKLKYFKRHRMELVLRYTLPQPELPAGFRWIAWDEDHLPLHAEVKFLSFHQELDSIIFPSFGTRGGCHELMTTIRFRTNFCPQATWLIAGQDGCVGTIQGLLDDNGYGGIQNLGVVPEYRGLGLGRALLLQALAGFRSLGVPRAFLEVTTTNESAVRMYRAIGFRAYKTLYRAVEVPEPDAVGVGL